MSSSFERGLAILGEVLADGETTVEAVARSLRIPISSAYRYFRVLRDQGFVSEDEGLYSVGRRVLGVAGRPTAQAVLVDMGNAVLRSIVDQVGETAVLIVRVGDQAMCLRREETRKSLKYTFAVNELLPLYAGAGQRMVLSWAPPEVVRQVLDGPMTRFTDRTLTREQLLAGIPVVRTSGVVVSRGELDEGSVSVAVPVMHRGELACSLNVAGPEARCGSKSWVASTLKVMREAAEILSEALEKCPPPTSTRERPDDRTTA